MESRSLPDWLLARIGAVLIAASGALSALAHVINPIGMSDVARVAITLGCLVSAVVIWMLPWNRMPSVALWGIAHSMLGLKVAANVLGGYGPYSYSIHFVLIAVWMGLALPRGSVLISMPLFAGAYMLPMFAWPEQASFASAVVVVPVATTIGECIGWVADRLRKVDAIQEAHREDLAWLLGAATRLAQDQDPQELVALIAQLSLRTPRATGVLVLTSEGNRRFSIATSIAWGGNTVAATTVRDEPAFVAATRGRTMLTWSDPLCVALAERLGVPGLCVIPLFGTRGCLGLVLVSGEPEGESSSDDGEMLRKLGETLAIQAGLALERQDIQASLREASLQDELTKLGNRRKAKQRLARLKSGNSLLLIDLDHFKRVNDELGHLRGDQVLRSLAQHLRDTVRHDDAVYRMGGEEFLIVLETDGAGAEHAAQRLLEGWRLREPETTFSLGLAAHEEGETADETFARADQALYAAKEGGRDQLRTAPSPFEDGDSD